MATRTFGVNRVGERPTSDISGSPAVNDVQSINVFNTQNTMDLSQQIADSKAAPTSPVGDLDYLWPNLEQTNKAIKSNEDLKTAKKALVAADMASDVMDSWFKHEAIVNQNNFNILQANRQIFQVQQQAGFAALREKVKTKSAQDTAKISAVARGQTTTGDVAGVAEGNEEMLLAMNLMNIEVSAARAVLGLRQDMIQYEASSKISKYQRNTGIANTLLIGGLQLGMM